MNRETLRQTVILIITSILVYYSGVYLLNLNGLKTFIDGTIVMLFFFALFPFMTYLVIIFKKMLAEILNAAIQ